MILYIYLYIANCVWCDSAGIILQKSKMYHATVCAERKNRALVQLLKVVTQEESALSTIIGNHSHHSTDGIIDCH